MKKKYTEEEVVTLLAAYAHSDGGNRSILEVKREWRNSYKHFLPDAEEWLLNVANKTMDERAADWFNRISPEHAFALENYHKETKGLTRTEIYIKTMLK